MISDDLHQMLMSNVPRGKRSAVIEEALKSYFEHQRRLAVRDGLIKARQAGQAGPAVSIDELVQALRDDRSTGRI